MEPIHLTDACGSVMLEAHAIIGEHTDEVYLIGGWAVALLLQQWPRHETPFKYRRTLDVDFSLLVKGAPFTQIRESLIARDYVPRYEGSTRFLRTVGDTPIALDLMGELRTDTDLFARCAWLAEVQGLLPAGEVAKATIKVAHRPLCLVMKARAFQEQEHHERDKDAYDIYALVAHTEGGPRAAARQVREFIEIASIQEGLHVLRGLFVRSDRGVTAAARFLRDEHNWNKRHAQTQVRGQMLEFFRELDL